MRPETDWDQLLELAATANDSVNLSADWRERKDSDGTVWWSKLVRAADELNGWSGGLRINPDRGGVRRVGVALQRPDTHTHVHVETNTTPGLELEETQLLAENLAEHVAAFFTRST